jgi:ketosteroid isomerase-like protein
MEQQRVRELAQQFIDGLHALEQAEGDGQAEVAALVALYADDAHLTNAALKLVSDERRGRDAIAKFWGEYKRTLGRAYSDFHQVTTNETAAGLFWVTRGTNVDGQQDAVAYDGATLLVFDDAGKITFFQGYYDTRQLNREMGVDQQVGKS